MAIYHLTTQTIGRGCGRSAVAAAYRAASRLVDERTGETFDFTRKGGVLAAEIVTPAGVAVPARGALWNAAEAAEKRRDARVAREWRAALPHELDAGEREALAKALGQALADRHGVAVDVCVHAPDRQGDDRSFHAHLLATTRRRGADGTLGDKAVIELGNKDRRKAGLAGTSQDDIRDIRREWAALANAALERAGRSERVDHRSYAEQGIALTPTRHIGCQAVAMDRRGVAGERSALHDAERRAQAEQIVARPEIVLESDAGERRTLWGADLRRALAESGARIGERIGLEPASAQTVRLPDGASAERVVWRVRGADDLARERLFEVLSRERVKESTLDFAERRGLDGEGVLRRWVEHGRARVSLLATRRRSGLPRSSMRSGYHRDDAVPHCAHPGGDTAG